MSNNTLILGDSYSTFVGYNPKGYPAYYPDEDTGVKNVNDTWWNILAQKAELNILENNSWSGSTICYTGYDNVDCSRTSSFIFRLTELIDNRFFTENDIDTVFVFGGTNDHWSGAPLGEMKFDGIKHEDLYGALPAICYLFKLLRNTVPKASICCLINTELGDEITDCFEKACEKYGITKISFDNIDKVNGHPTPRGMQEIAETVLKAIAR